MGARYDDRVARSWVPLFLLIGSMACTAERARPAATPKPPEEKSAEATVVTPEALPTPTVEEPKPKPPKKPGAYANVDPEDDFVVGPPEAMPDCEAELEKAGVKFAKATL